MWLRVTSLEQLSLAEFMGEYTRPKDPQTQLTGVLIRSSSNHKIHFASENKVNNIKLDCFNVLNNF